MTLATRLAPLAMLLCGCARRAPPSTETTQPGCVEMHACRSYQCQLSRDRFVDVACHLHLGVAAVGDEIIASDSHGSFMAVRYDAARRPVGAQAALGTPTNRRFSCAGLPVRVRPGHAERDICGGRRRSRGIFLFVEAPVAATAQARVQVRPCPPLELSGGAAATWYDCPNADGPVDVVVSDGAARCVSSSDPVGGRVGRVVPGVCEPRRGPAILWELGR